MCSKNKLHPHPSLPPYPFVCPQTTFTDGAQYSNVVAKPRTTDYIEAQGVGIELYPP